MVSPSVGDRAEKKQRVLSSSPSAEKVDSRGKVPEHTQSTSEAPSSKVPNPPMITKDPNVDMRSGRGDNKLVVHIKGILSRNRLGKQTRKQWICYIFRWDGLLMLLC